MIILAVLGIWAAIMTAITNPGYVDPETVMKYTKEDLNRKLVRMFLAKGRSNYIADFNSAP